MISGSAAYTAANANRSKAPLHVAKLNPHPNLLVGAWELDEASGQRADYTGRSEFTPVNSPGTAAGKIGSSVLSLASASSQYLYCAVPDNSCLIINDESFTVHVWGYLASKGADRYLVSHWESTVPQESWYLYYNNTADRFQFVVCDTGISVYTASATTLGSPSINTWYWFVLKFDAVNRTISISVNNGAADSATLTSTPFQGSLEDFRVGAVDLGAGVTAFWNGRAEQLVIWRRLITSAEMTAWYNSGSGVPLSTITDPNPSVFSTGPNSAGENLGSYLLELDELNYETAIDKLEGGPISALTFELKDVGSVVSALVATNLVGYKVRLYSGYYSLAFADFVQVFGGRITDIAQHNGRYRFTCRSFLTYAQKKLIFDDPQTVLVTAINSTDTTWVLQDASAFPNAQSVPQCFRRVVQIDSEIATYRGRAKNADGTWNLTNVVRSASVGFPFPPYYGGPASHSANAVVRHLPKLGSLTPESSQAANRDMHPMVFAQNVLNNIGERGLGEFNIPLDLPSWQAAETALGRSLQFRTIFGDAVNGKTFLEDLCRDVAGFLIERADGSVGIKLVPPVSTLHAAWKLEESSGDRADVMHANRSRNYNLTAVNSPGSTTGKVGSAIQLTAASSQYLWRSYGGLQPAATSFSVAVWVYMDSKGGPRTVCGQWDVATLTHEAWRILYDNSVDRLRFVITDGTTTKSLSANNLGAPSTATWYLITASFNASTLEMRLSVNDGTVDTMTGVIPVPTDRPFTVGTSYNGGGFTNFFDGRVDELAMWFDHVLTASEITWLYNSGSGRAIENFPANFPTSSPSSVDTVTDSHLLARPQWLRNGEGLYNHVIWHYDFLPPTGKYTSTFDYKDQSLIDTIGKDLPLEIFSTGIRSRNYSSSGGIFCWFDATERFLMNRSEAIIQRFGREAPFIGGKAHYRKHLLESLNDVTATFDQVVDLTTGSRSLSSASCELSRVRHNYKTYEIELELAKYA